MKTILNYKSENVQKYGNSWFDKKIVIFGDSRTWYDGQTYDSNTKSEWNGKKCVGYQQTIIKRTGAKLTNQGASGEGSTQIASRVRAFNFSSYDAVILGGGVNDKFFKNLSDGELMPAGSQFDTNTIYGAWQSAVEYILNNYPNIIIFLTIPPIAWVNDVVYSYDTAIIKEKVARLYNLPCLNLYQSMGINEYNRDYYYADDVTKTNKWRLHFNDHGNELLGHIISNGLSGLLLSNDVQKDDLLEIQTEIYNLKSALFDSKKLIFNQDGSVTWQAR